MALPIYTQGTLDGLCGVYAFVNSYIHRITRMHSMVDGSLGGNLSEDLFAHALNSVPKKLFPTVIWEGLNVSQLTSICRRACKNLDKELGWKHKINLPFRPRQFETTDEFFDALIPYAISRNLPSHAIILGLDGEPGHWVAFKNFRGTKVRLLNNGRENLMETSEFSVGKRGKNRIVQEETIVISLTSLS